MKSLQKVQTEDVNLNRAQDKIADALNPILKNVLNSGSVLENIALVTGSNTVNHGLGRALQGWFIIRQRSGASIYDNQSNNSTPNLTLLLVSDANVTVNLYVF